MSIHYSVFKKGKNLDLSTTSLWPHQDSIGEIQKFHQSMESFLHDLVVVIIVVFGCPQTKYLL